MARREPAPAFPEASDDLVRLAALGADALVALIGGDADAADRLVGADWPRPLEAPPLVGDHLDLFLDRLRAEGAESGWWNWAIVERASGTVAGMIGLGGPPDADGAVEVGYTLFEDARGRGLAGAALRLVAGLVADRPGVRILRAAVPPDHAASLRVAERAGLRPVGADRRPDVGEVIVLERRVRPPD